MSLVNAEGPRRRRGRRLFRRNSTSNQHSSSNDDMESLGMESGSANGNHTMSSKRRGRFRMRRSQDDSDIGHKRPEVITTTARAKSADDVSFDWSRNGSNSRTSKQEPRPWRRLNPLGVKYRRSNNRDAASDAGSDRSSLQQYSLQNGDSFDSDNMLNHVRTVDPSTQYQRRNKLLPSDPILADGGFTIHTNESNQEGETVDISEAPIKRISFEEDIPQEFTGRATDYSGTLNSRGGVFRSIGEGSVASQASTQTYRSMGANDIVSERARYSGRDGARANRKKYRVHPYHCFNDAVYMTEEEIYNDSTKPSLHSEILKSYLAPSTKSHKTNHVTEDISQKYGTPQDDGRIGSLCCEVLGCVSLVRKSKPDVCVYMVVGDTAFCTDIIHGYRSPMWPSVSRRSAVFPIHHAYTRLYAGVFDVRARKNKENDVFCGRVCIDVASLRPNTEYDITFPLRASTFVYDKQKRGVLRLRFSLHWFSERAAVLSYFDTPRTLDTSSPLAQGFPTIPCADPKTFRNVAVTVHGNDLPGKYSRSAFKATVREFQLYQLNIRYMLKYLVIDAVMYEKPYISLYLFLAGMHCVLTESVSKVPPYIMGFLIILYLESYKHYVSDTVYNEGYQPLTLIEVFKALVSKTGSADKYFEPILVTKRAKKRSNRRNPRTLRRIQSDSPGATTTMDDGENILLDHKEFPFSDRDAYPKFTVDEALAPSSRNTGGGNMRLHGRLSVYYAPTGVDQGAGLHDSADDDDDESSDESAGDETIMEGAGIYDQAFDLDDVDDEETLVDPSGGHPSNPQQLEAASRYGYGDEGPNSPVQGENGKIRKIIHSAQNIDESGGAAVPPQVTVKRVENLFHKNSYSIAVEKVVAPPTKEHVKLAMNTVNESQEKLAITPEEIEKEIDKMRKAYLDEFDKLLGLQSKSSNPISKMFATFLGPLMRILRIPVFIFRISFNAYTWRDPYLSFWLFRFMCIALIVLMAFPWRLFFFLVTVVGLGPQNIFLRRYLEKRALESKEAQSMDKNDNNDSDSAPHSNAIKSALSSVPRPRIDYFDSVSIKLENRRGLFGRMKNRGKSQIPAESTDLFMTQDRPPFSSAFSSSTNNRKLRPRSVVVPYSKLRKDRFYFWPPDPTVSRATPLEFESWPMDHMPEEFTTKSTDEPERLGRRSSTGHDSATSDGMPAAESLRRRRGSL